MEKKSYSGLPLKTHSMCSHGIWTGYPGMWCSMGCGFCFSDSGTGYKNHPLFLEEEWSANRLPKPHLQWIASLGDFHFAQLHLGACAQARRGLYCMYFSLTLEIKRVDFFPIIPEFLSKLWCKTMLLLLFRNWASHRQSWPSEFFLHKPFPFNFTK